MADFNNFDDQNTEGTNVNITDSDDPSKKASVTNGELNVNNSSGNLDYNVFSVGTSAVRIDTPVLTNRKQVDITVQKLVYIGFDNSVSSTNFAYKLFKGQAIGLDIKDTGELWAISEDAGGTADVAVAQGASS